MNRLKTWLRSAYPHLLSLLILGFFLFKIITFWQTVRHDELINTNRYWFEHQKWFLTAFILFLFLSSFAIRFLKEIIIVSFILGYYLTTTWILQDHAYDFLMFFRFYELIGKPHFAHNPEFAHLTLISFGIIAVIISFARPTLRIRKAMVVCYSLVILFILYFAHNITSTPFIKSTHADRVTTLQNMMDFAKEKKDIDRGCMVLNCIVFDITDRDREEGFVLPSNLDFNKPIYEATIQKALNVKIAIEYRTHFNSERNPILLAAKNYDGRTYLVVDSQYLDRLWKRMRGSYSGIVALAILAWTFILFLVIEIHHFHFLSKMKKLNGKPEPHYEI